MENRNLQISMDIKIKKMKIWMINTKLTQRKWTKRTTTWYKKRTRAQKILLMFKIKHKQKINMKAVIMTKKFHCSKIKKIWSPLFIKAPVRLIEFYLKRFYLKILKTIKPILLNLRMCKLRNQNQFLKIKKTLIIICHFQIIWTLFLFLK